MPTRIRWVYRLIFQRIYKTIISNLQNSYTMAPGKWLGDGTFKEWSGPTSTEPGLHTYILHPVLLSQTSLSMSCPDYPPSIPSLFSQPGSPLRIGIHFLPLPVPILQSRLLACLMPSSRSEVLTSSLSDLLSQTPFTAISQSLYPHSA